MVDVDASFEDVSTPERKRATYSDLEALPGNVIGELIDGELFALPRPAIPHNLAAMQLSMRLSTFQAGFGRLGGWWFLFEPELHFGDDVLVPDLAGWRGEALPEQNRAFITVAPDWLCEVLSPSTAGIDRTRKLPVYARAQVRHVWLLDPLARTLEVLRRSGTGWAEAGAFAGDARVRADPFEALELDLAALWPEGG
jgi:Uma2 family endonuclease